MRLWSRGLGGMLAALLLAGVTLPAAASEDLEPEVTQYPDSNLDPGPGWPDMTHDALRYMLWPLPMVGGELLFERIDAQEFCVARSDQTIVGCFPAISRGRTVNRQGETLFRYREGDAVTAFQM